jgi:outer membrane usher protein
VKHSAALLGIGLSCIGGVLVWIDTHATKTSPEKAIASEPKVRGVELLEPKVRAVELVEPSPVRAVELMDMRVEESKVRAVELTDPPVRAIELPSEDLAPTVKTPSVLRADKALSVQTPPKNLPILSAPLLPQKPVESPATETGAIIVAARPKIESDEEVFARLFPRKSGEVRSVVVPFFMDGVALGEVLVELEGESVQFVAAPLLLALTPKVEEKVSQTLAAAIDARGRLSLQSVQASGLGASFDASRLELQLTTSPGLLASSVHRLQTLGLPDGADEALRPSNFSGYLNAKGAQRVTWSSDAEIENERQAFALELDGALQWRGWVLEGRPDFLEDREQSWRRGDLLLLRDDPTRALRYLAGDFSMPSSGFQPSLPVIGVGVIRNFALQPYVGTHPSGRFEFFLEKPAEVTVLVNSITLQTLKLPAGHHDLRDLPMAFSVNDIKLVIREDTGLTHELSFRASTAGALLAPGKHQFAYSVGAPVMESVGEREYDFTQPVFSGSHRIGVTDTLTIGGYLNASIEQQIAGPQLLWATKVGTLGLEFAGSHDATTGEGVAVAARYDYLWAGSDGTPRRLSVTAEHRSNGFQPLGALLNLYSDDVLVSYGQRIGASLQMDLSARYQAGQNGALDAQTAAAILSRSFKSGLALSMFTSVRLGGTDPNEARAMLTARWALPKKGHSFQLLSKNSTVEERTNQATWTYQNHNPLEAVAASASLAQSESDYEVSGLVGYTNQRVQANLSSTALLQDDAALQGTTSAEVSTALVFAGGKFALSRPVSGAFAIIAPNETVRDYPIEVNPGPYGDQARTSWFGPAVIPNLQAYHVQDIKLIAPTLPVGYSLGAGSFAVLPSYKSGTLLRVGEEGTVSLRGELHFPDGTPVSLVSGELVAVGTLERKTVFLFTNRAGRFGLEAVAPGKYELRLVDALPVVIEIPAGQHGGYSVGVLTVNKQP